MHTKFRTHSVEADSVSRLMIGGNVFGHFADYSQTRQILDVAFDSGLRAIDTADVYSDGVSEEFIGNAILGRRNQWFIATKAGIKSGESTNGLGQRSTILKKVHASLKRLKTDVIDLYQLHNYDTITPIDETVDVFSELIRRGDIRAAGVCNFIKSGAPVCPEGVPKEIEFFQEPINIISRNDWVQKIGDKRLIAYSVLHRGLLNSKYVTGIPLESRAAGSESIRRDLSECYLTRLKTCTAICERFGTDITSVAIAYVLNLNRTCKAIVGFRSVIQMQDMLIKLNRPIPHEVVLVCRNIFANGVK